MCVCACVIPKYCSLEWASGFGGMERWNGMVELNVGFSAVSYTELPACMHACMHACMNGVYQTAHSQLCACHGTTPPFMHETETEMIVACVAQYS